MAERDIIPLDQTKELEDKPFYVAGHPYQFILTHGWVLVGHFICFVDPMTIKLENASYYNSAGNQTHASLARNGGNSETTWEYCGRKLINRMHIIHASEYFGKVHRGGD